MDDAEFDSRLSVLRTFAERVVWSAETPDRLTRLGRMLDEMREAVFDELRARGRY